MNETKTFSTKRLSTRQINPELDSIQDYLEWTQDIESNRYILSAKTNYAMDELLQYENQKNSSEDVLLFRIFLRSSGNFIVTV
jgi:hypothetical protein